jgi:phage terminase large subunit GpA-like protein
MEAQTHQSAQANLATVRVTVYAHYDPPPDVTVSEWATNNRVLPKGTTSRPGPFRPERFQIEMMNVILDPNIHEIIVQKSTQVGYSDAVLNNILGYYVDADPKPIMLVQPTIDNAKDYGKKRITPMIEACAALRRKIKPPTSRRAGNTLALKEFPGGFLKLTGANSGAGLRSDPVPIVLFDEVDGYPLDVEGEGDPVAIGTRRTDAYNDYKIVKGSTPAKPRGISPIERDFQRSDMRRFYVPCPFCGHSQVARSANQGVPAVLRSGRGQSGEAGERGLRVCRLQGEDPGAPQTADDQRWKVGSGISRAAGRRVSHQRAVLALARELVSAGAGVARGQSRKEPGKTEGLYYPAARRNVGGRWRRY